MLAITGSAGKTTTKAFVAQLLATRYGTRVLAAPANENNEVGVSKLLLRADDDAHDIVIVEMGARHYGDIETLVRAARPDLAILTNIGDAHLEIMGSRERLEETKWALFATGARAILNAGDVTAIRRAPSLAAPAHWFFSGEPGGDFPMHGRVTALAGARQWLEIDGERDTTYEIDMRVPGAHNRANMAAAIAAAVEYGVEPAQIVRALPEIELPRGRYERIALPSGVMLIYDAYNANAAGMMAALDAFAAESAPRHIALLASMAELGEGAADLHRRVGGHAAATKVDVMLVGGEFAGELALGARTAGLPSERIVPFMTNEQAARGFAPMHAPAMRCCSRVRGNITWKRSSRSYVVDHARPRSGGDPCAHAHRAPGRRSRRAVAAAVRGIARPGDVIAISETAVAIAQGDSSSPNTFAPRGSRTCLRAKPVRWRRSVSPNRCSS